ncbi:MAG: type II toxin-antitoxin system VapB family antitoxin [Terriglobales bacterium]
MRTHIDLDDVLIGQAMRLGGFKAKTAAVHAALAEYVRAQKRKALLRLRGQVHWEGDPGALRAMRTRER